MVVAPKVVGATWPSSGRSQGCVQLEKSWSTFGSIPLPPLRYESVQTAFVPKTHADAGVLLLLNAAEVSREWQKEIVVLQLDVKKAFDHVEHRAAFKAMRLQYKA